MTRRLFRLENKKRRQETNGIFFQDDGSSLDNSSHNLGHALVSLVWFWVTLILCSALLAVVTYSIWQHGQLQVFLVMAQPTDQNALKEIESEPAQPENKEHQEAPLPSQPPDLNAWPVEPEPLAQPDHRVCMTPVGSQMNGSFPSLHQNNSYRSVSGRESQQLITDTAKILLEMEAIRHQRQQQQQQQQQQRRSSQATLGTYDKVRSSYASGLDEPTGWTYRPGPSQHRRTPSIRRDWSLPPLPNHVSTLPRRAHQH